MASPQVENGYTKVANEILEQVMKTSLNGTQFRILMAVWRYTYGFRRVEHEMSIRFIAEAINASRSQVDRELTALKDRMILNVTDNGPRKPRLISYNKNHDSWMDCAPGRGQSTISDMQKQKPKKRRATKKVFDEDNTYYKMAKYFFDKVEVVAKDAGVEHLIKKANLQSWADDFRKLVEVDGIEDKKLIVNVMEWVTTNSFWKTNVLSGKKFREKFGELAIKMSEDVKPKQQQASKPVKDPRDKEIALQKWIADGGDPDEFNWSD